MMAENSNLPESEGEAGCFWSAEMQSGWENYYHTECGFEFQFTVGNPIDNNFIFCPFCGAEIADATPPKSKKEVN